MEKLKYPLLMVHGMGFRDNRVIGYWGRIPKALEKCGAEVFFGGQDSNGSIEGNAAQLKKTIEAVLRQTGAEKVNIIAHSKGGLEARYLISTMGMAGKVASLTTISTPHNGSVTVDRLMDIVPQPLVKLGCGVTDLWFRILGDRSPDTYSAVNSFKTNSADIFNIKNPDSPEVYYQSCAFAMKKPTSDIFMSWTWLAVNRFEGENDGLLAPRAAKWTNFMGTFYGTDGRGISHCDEVDMRRSAFSKKKDGAEADIDDITEFYSDIVRGLISKGF